MATYEPGIYTTYVDISAYKETSGFSGVSYGVRLCAEMHDDGCCSTIETAIYHLDDSEAKKLFRQLKEILGEE